MEFCGSALFAFLQQVFEPNTALAANARAIQRHHIPCYVSDPPLDDILAPSTPTVRPPAASAAQRQVPPTAGRMHDNKYAFVHQYYPRGLALRPARCICVVPVANSAVQRCSRPGGVRQQ
jgi:hypothetical protein